MKERSSTHPGRRLLWLLFATAVGALARPVVASEPTEPPTLTAEPSSARS